jgi:hypothetical protein
MQGVNAGFGATKKAASYLPIIVNEAETSKALGRSTLL